MPSKKSAQLISNGTSDKKEVEDDLEKAKEELIDAQLQALEWIKKVRDIYTQGIVKLRERSHRKKVVLSHLRIGASLEDSTRVNLSETYDHIRTLQFDIDNLKHKVAEEKARAPQVPEPGMTDLILKTIQLGFAGVQTDLQAVKQRLDEIDQASKESVQATLNARDDIVTEIQRSAIDERGELRNVWDDT